jgi:hypothetical protein
MESFIGSESDVDCDSGFVTRRSAQISPDETPTDPHGGLNPRLFDVAGVVNGSSLFYKSKIFCGLKYRWHMENFSIPGGNT